MPVRIENRTRFESVLLLLREMVLNGELPPGVRIREVAVGKRLGVSRTPVRNALTILEQEGLVHGQPNRGFTVRAFTLPDVLAAYDVRSVLEGYACRVIAEYGLTGQPDLVLEDCVRQGERLLEAGFFDATTVRSWTDINGIFHRTIVLASGNPLLERALSLINQHPLAAPTSIMFRTGNLERFFCHMQQAQRDHVAVLSALRRGQAVRAESLMAEHILGARENVHDEVRRGGLELPDLMQRLSGGQVGGISTEPHAPTSQQTREST